MTSRSRCSRALFAVVVGLAVAACGGGEDDAQLDTSLDGLAVTKLNPGTVLPGSVLVVEGTSFVAEPWGSAQLRLKGEFGGSSIDVTVPAAFADYTQLHVDVSADLLDLLPARDGEFRGDASVQILSSVDNLVHESPALAVTLRVASELTPRIDTLHSTGVIHVNEPITVVGDGLLLGGGEGKSYAVVEGCFQAQGESNCAPLPSSEILLEPSVDYDRTQATFAFAPEIAGIRPGTFVGSVYVRNDHTDAATTESEAHDADYELLKVRVAQVTPEAASLGQYVDVRGGGFVGGAANEQTLLELRGTFTRDGGEAAELNMILVPEFVSGPLVRYVLNEDDALGGAIDMRKHTGTFTGTVTPLVSYKGDQVTGDTTNISFQVAPIKQVVYLNFLPSYRESLRKFGLRALDARIRQRIIEVARRDYATINVEFRESVPTDFAHYTQVDVAGPDPNGQGLLGYDNTPGKDNNNKRLFDRIGGVNATTQEDGYPGYGGVFIESLFSFSKHPNGLAGSIDNNDEAFDDIFDHFRPDQGGLPVNAADFDEGIPTLSDGASCPADTRVDRAACAVWVLGSLIGTTLTHEIGHSLGMANPGGEGFHNFGDQPGRLMDPGGARPFTERAELFNEGPAIFCDEEYTYLRRILPTNQPETTTPRPHCF